MRKWKQIHIVLLYANAPSEKVFTALSYEPAHSNSMNKERNPPKRYHLNRYQYNDINDWEPPRTRDPQLAMMRRQHPRTLVIEQQSRSLHALTRFAEHEFDTPSEREYAKLLIARTSIGAASYDLHSDTMYSQLNLARMAEGSSKDGNIWYETPQGINAKVRQQLGWSAEMGGLYLDSRRSAVDPELTERRRRHTGRLMGNVALGAIMIDMPKRIHNMDTVDAQVAVREHTMDFIEEVREYAQDIGVLPSVAQLAEPDSPLVVDIRRNAPTPVLRAYEQAIAAFPEQRAA